MRVDQALESGQVVSTAYDPMLGKVIAHGPDREAARRALVEALDATGILGLTTNTGFLRALVASDEFRLATIDTAWLDTAVVEPPDREVPRVFAAWVQAMLVAVQDTGHPFQADGWRLGGTPAPTVVELDETVLVDRARRPRGRPRGPPAQSAENHVAVLTVDGTPRGRGRQRAAAHAPRSPTAASASSSRSPDVFADHGPAAGDGSVLAPMPGTVLDVRVDRRSDASTRATCSGWSRR